ncbi:MAG TPA: ABC transporter ATP-binding protein, partial [Planctomycetaceae bacterium]|nr:ABC transporter ATP-binding protein [Planctomycetaceae bacterium]
TERFGVEPRSLGGTLRIERTRGHEFLRELVDAFPEDITSVSLGKPSLEDVFITKTGHRFWEDA